jgi:hypothetical protein
MTHINDISCLNAIKLLEPGYGVNINQDMMINFMVGNALFACPDEFTGIATLACEYLARTDKRVTSEHMYSRKESAVTIMNGVKKGWSDRRILATIRSRCRVNVTLRSENQILKPFQQSATTHPRLVYAAAGLATTTWMGPKWYTIEGKDYHLYDRLDIATDYDIPPAQISYRCGSKAPKWAGWKMTHATKQTGAS